MAPPLAHRAVAVTLLGIALGCGDPDWQGRGGVGSRPAAVVGGWPATGEQIFATIEIRRAGASRGFCSGALISPSLVVTAAHCAVVEPDPGVVLPAEPGSLFVAAGHLSSDSVTDSMLRPVIDIRVHEEYDHDFVMGRSRAGAGQGGIGSPNDIALLVVGEPYDQIPSAPVLTAERQIELVRHGDVGFVAGYGVYDLDDRSTGALYISDAVIDIIGPRELLTRRRDELGDSCYGDSGGPLYLPTDAGDFLVGLVSRGRSDVELDCGDGGVYTLVAAHLPWIAASAGGLFDPKLQSYDETFSFLEEGAEAFANPEGGSLHGVGRCSASNAGAPTLPWALAWLLGLAMGSRGAFRRASARR